MIVTVDWMRQNYNKYNQLCWGGKLPGNIEFVVNQSSKYWGYASYSYSLRNNTVTPTRITLSNYWDSPESVKLNTLIHEMVHIADYTFNPWNFLNRSRSGRSRYDAHGGAFFIPEARRLRQFGFDVQKNVTDEEQAVSTLSDHQQEILDKNLKNGIHVLIFEYTEKTVGRNGKMYKFGYVRTGKTNYLKYVDKFTTMVDQGKLMWLDDYLATDSAILKLTANKYPLWTITNDTQRVIDNYNLRYNETIFGSHGGVVDANDSVEEVHEDENKELKELITKYKKAIVNSIAKHIEAHYTGLFADDELNDKYPINFKNGEQRIDVVLNSRGENCIRDNKLYVSYTKRDMDEIIRDIDPRSLLEHDVNFIIDVILR